MSESSERPIVAIDPSIRGFAVGTYAQGEVSLVEWGTEAKDWPKSMTGRLSRYRYVVDRVVAHLKKQGPVLLLIEGYAFNAKGRSVTGLCELGGILRDRAVGIADQTIEVPPSVIKKFATGKGNAGKMEVVQALVKRYGLTFKTDNEADAFALVQLGRIVAGYAVPDIKVHGECAEVVRGLLRQETQHEDTA